MMKNVHFVLSVFEFLVVYISLQASPPLLLNMTDYFNSLLLCVSWLCGQQMCVSTERTHTGFTQETVECVNIHNSAFINWIKHLLFLKLSERKREDELHCRRDREVKKEREC